MNLDHHQKEFVKLLQRNAGRFRAREVFRDFCELSALAISNRHDRLHYEAREARYLDLISKYTKEEIARFPEMLNCVVASLARDHHDCLGELFMSLEMGDAGKGQFFTPYSVSQLMARMTIKDVDSTLETQRYLTVHEPACGSGGMVLAVAQILMEKCYMPMNRMHAVCVDVDATAVHMTYVQLSLMGVPAIVVHGNTLTLKEWDHWATTAHMVFGWDQRLAADAAARAVAKAADTKCEANPTKQDEADTVEPDQTSQAPSTDVGDEVVAQRMAKAEQLGLF